MDSNKLGPKFEESDAYKTVSLHLKEKVAQGKKREERRQKKLMKLREEVSGFAREKV